ncbi:MAG: glycosyltransferase family 4 protein [Deltaproteobacteria bacterium]|nr:glycosyltransferase family 4 protein [Deltaproteobacteria bacterium]
MMLESRDRAHKVTILFPLRFNSLRVGGVASFNREIIENLSPRYQVLDLTFNRNVKQVFYENVRWWYRVKRYAQTLSDLFLLSVGKLLNDVDIIHLSPSLDITALLRDLLYAEIAIKRGIPFVVFFHGWKKSIENLVDRSCLKKIIAGILNKAEAIWVLSTEFKTKLVDWGVEKEKIILGSTMVANDLFTAAEIDEKLSAKVSGHAYKILFLGRMVREKGIYEVVDTFKLLKEKYADVKLVIAGDGPEAVGLQQYVLAEKIDGVVFTGFISGEDKRKILLQCDLFFLPSYSEGLPISVLEAMASAMPVVVSRVGGIKDFFVDGRMGFAVESLEPASLFLVLDGLLSDEKRMKQIGLNNHLYAANNFSAAQVVGRIETVYDKIWKMS